MERTLEKGVVEHGRLHSAFHRENTHFQVCFLSVAIIQLWLQQLCPLLVIYLWPVIGIGVRKRVSLLCQNRPSLQTTDLYSSLKVFLKWPSYWILTSRVPTEEQLTGSEWDPATESHCFLNDIQNSVSPVFPGPAADTAVQMAQGKSERPNLSLLVNSTKICPDLN